MAITITTATLENLPSMFAIEEASFRTPWSLALLQAEFSHEQARIRVAYRRDPWGKEDEVLVGFCLSWVVADELQILQIAVDPSCRRNGIGRMLLRDVQEIAKMESALNLFLEVRASNEAAIGLYHSCGFTQAGLRKKYYKSPTEDAVVLVKKLKHHDLRLRR